jgi:ribosomal RNA-processing protein 12
LLLQLKLCVLAASPSCPALLACWKGYLCTLIGCVPRRTTDMLLPPQQVVAVVLPLEQLQPFLPQILEGLLLWCEDSKNKFKLKVRSIVERLAKRCGFEAMAQAMPPSDSRLLAHIRKESNRKQRRASQAGSVVGAC